MSEENLLASKASQVRSIKNMLDFVNCKLSSKVCVFAFCTQWCEDCTKVLGSLKIAGESFDYDIGIFKVDIDDCKNLFAANNVNSIPLVIIFANGREFIRLDRIRCSAGYRPYFVKAILACIEKNKSKQEEPYPSHDQMKPDLDGSIRVSNFDI